VIVALGGWVDHRHAIIYRDERAICGSCKARLVGFTGQIAVATGRCGKCGALLISDA
jgi:hypothetical protein